MKVLVLLLAVLFSAQDTFAAYCSVSGNLPYSGDNKSRKLNSITITDGEKSLEVTSIQKSSSFFSRQKVYVDKTSSVLETYSGAELRFSNISWNGSWMQGYVFIDYDKDQSFDNTANNDGTTGGELVSYNCYNVSNDYGTDILGNSVYAENAPTASNMPSWKLPEDLPAGDYRLRFNIAWNSIDPCGYSNMASDGGAMVDITLRVSEPPVPQRTINVVTSNAEWGTVSGGGTASGTITITATPNNGYAFLNWTLNDAVVATTATYEDRTAGDKTYVANFEKDPRLDRTGWTVTASSQEESGEGAGNGVASCIVDGQTSTFWHSKWQGSEAGYPHWFMIDMKSSKSFDAFEYVSRGTGTSDDGENNGNIVNYQIYVSDTEINPNSLPTPVATGTFSYTNGSTSHKVELGKSVKGRYVMLYTTGQSANGRVNASCAEFYLFSRSFTVTVSSSNVAMGNVYIGAQGITSVDCSSEGTDTAVLTAVPVSGYEFVNWTLNGTIISTDAVYTTDAVTETREYVANFKFKPVDPREVKVASNDASKGYATIISPQTSESSIVTGEMVTVKAVAANNNAFVNWIVNGVVVSTEATYTYSGAEPVTLQANFATRYTITINQVTGGTITVRQGTTALNSGATVGEGTTLTITAKGSGINWVKAIMVNGENVMTTSQASTYTVTVKVKSTTTITAVYSAPKVILTYEYSGNGYIEVWSSDSYNEGDEETYPVEPAGFKYNMWDEVEDGICIFSFPGAGSELISLTINGESQDLNADLAEYGDIYVESPSEPVHIVAVYSGQTPDGVETTEADATNIYAVAGGVVVEAAEATAVEVYTIAGTLAQSKVVSGVETIAMQKGVYIVKTAGKVLKVIVK